MKKKSINLLGLFTGCMLIAGCSQTGIDKGNVGESGFGSIATIADTGAENSSSSKTVISGDNSNTQNSIQTSESGNLQSSDGSVDSSDDEDTENRQSTTAGSEFKIDFEHDYSEEIKADVEAVVSSASNLTEEFTLVDKLVSDKYGRMINSAVTQFEYNVAAGWEHHVWDCELNNLWGRFTKLADQQTKERVLADEKSWIAMQDEIFLEYLGTREENGSIYPQERQELLENIAKTRCYIIANEIAKIKGESFTMKPVMSDNAGIFIDNQGTGSVYSSLLLRLDWEFKNEAVISIYRTGTISGSYKDNGNGEIQFTAKDSSIEGIIRINGFDGASFEVTASNGNSSFNVGDKFQFPFVYLR
ncbi:lysozyme inhibitor LprI family protein [Butyrivibrio sp. NC3005]|uniref:lysozyme inhibitor LprI family protein n=1 Tax=Butyrivibrio sp. NC3005 TaxID=1280685 RepID=UPI0003FDB2E7|nr:lysozyme inhibitor LprI family protein [Butyrivibrio sp. NC3005]